MPKLLTGSYNVSLFSLQLLFIILLFTLRFSFYAPTLPSLPFKCPIHKRFQKDKKTKIINLFNVPVLSISLFIACQVYVSILLSYCFELDEPLDLPK